ncbi:MAG TPA: hypothetical protein VMU95_09540 [Trebonia sp.]|nr:hypothetical protein [Trebonia sp.]
MTKLDRAFRADGLANEPGSQRRKRAWAVAGLAPAIIVAATTTLALALSGCSSSSLTPAARLSVWPSATASHSARPLRTSTATARATHSARPVTTPTPSLVPAPTGEPQPTTVPQQDCYAPPHPTCTIPPPPSSLTHASYITTPTAHPRSTPVIIETG